MINIAFHNMKDQLPPHGATEALFEESFDKSQAEDGEPKDFTLEEAIDKARKLSKPYKPSKKLKKKLLKSARKTIKEI